MIINDVLELVNENKRKREKVKAAQNIAIGIALELQ